LWSLFFIFLIRYYVYTFFSCKYIIQTFIKLKIFNLSDVYYQDNTLPEVQKRINIWSEKAKLIVQTSLQLQNLCIYIYFFFFCFSTWIWYRSKKDIYIHDQTSAGTPFLPSAIFTASKHDRNLSFNSLLYSARISFFFSSFSPFFARSILLVLIFI